MPASVNEQPPPASRLPDAKAVPSPAMLGPGSGSVSSCLVRVTLTGGVLGLSGMGYGRGIRVCPLDGSNDRTKAVSE